MQTSSSYQEKALLLLIAEGDERAFFGFYDFYSNLLRSFLWKYTRSETDIEEIIQETFIKVWLHRDELPEIQNMRAWLFRISSRVYLDHVDRQIRLQQRNELFGNLLYGAGSDTSAERTHLQEVGAAIRKAVEGLTEQKKKVFLLNREMDLKPAQISAQLNIPVGTVRNQLSAALREIREQLVAVGYHPLSIMPLFAPSFLFF